MVQLFLSFSVSITEFIAEHGYQGDASDIDAKVAFMRIKKPPHAAGAQTVDKKLFSPEGGE